MDCTRDAETRSAGPILGQLLRLSTRRMVAIYLRGERLWIADFIDGRGELVDPKLWFRFNCGTPLARYARRRTLLEAPLSMEIVEKIEELHRNAARHLVSRHGGAKATGEANATKDRRGT